MSFSLTLEAVGTIGSHKEIKIQYSSMDPGPDFVPEELVHLIEHMMTFKTWYAGESLSDDYMIRMHQMTVELYTFE
ncbi:hypothetical protein ARMSODRAFT_1023211 [Armillaria solidipes]|uniref:Uncharacterized protein n=1 Tax=Armillaria solidipes TaxID=1076256 RepID=A0A2H3BBE5_9AGAR|nr:hypothetical protein ARMSODRAFT_1023211 [Armillaria solidipes]